MTTCLECGASLPEGVTCREYRNTMIAWDFEDFLGVGQVHHLTVVNYNLQHPGVYSQKGLEDAKGFLVEFLEENFSFKEHDERNRARLASNVRDWKITGTSEDHGSYDTAPMWTMTAQDVVEGGLENYVENVKKWSDSVYKTLSESGNLK